MVVKGVGGTIPCGILHGGVAKKGQISDGILGELRGNSPYPRLWCPCFEIRNLPVWNCRMKYWTQFISGWFMYISSTYMVDAHVCGRLCKAPVIIHTVFGPLQTHRTDHGGPTRLIAVTLVRRLRLTAMAYLESDSCCLCRICPID